MSELSDDELLEKIKRGHTASFEQLVRRHSKKVFGIAYQLSGSRALADEIAQETWIKVAKSAESYEQGNARGWIMRICRNTALNELRKRHHAEEVFDEGAMDRAEDFTLSPEDLVRGEQDRTKLRECLGELPDRQRLALVLFMTDDASVEQIASELEMKPNAAKALLFRARENLKVLMSQEKGGSR